jgi:hypothetical protein
MCLSMSWILVARRCSSLGGSRPGVRFTANANLCTYECASNLDCPGASQCDKSAPPTGILPGNGICAF